MIIAIAALVGVMMMFTLFPIIDRLMYWSKSAPHGPHFTPLFYTISITIWGAFLGMLMWYLLH